MKKILLPLFCLFVFYALSVPAVAQEVDTTMWATNGEVHAIARRGNNIYLGGNFSYVGPPTGGGVVLNTTDGKRTGAPLLHVVGMVIASIPDGRGGWYIGGSFSAVQGVERTSLAHILADGRVDRAWNPVMGDESGIETLVLDGNTLYLGGTFRLVNGQRRSCLAAVDATTGRLTDWNPGADAYVNTMAVSGNVVYVGGEFGTVAGQSRSLLAAIDAATGRALDWNPQVTHGDSPGWIEVSSIVLSGNTVLVGGRFGQVGNLQRKGLAAVDAVTGRATAWNPVPEGDVSKLLVAGSVVYVGGWFTSIGGLPRNGLAAVELSTGRVTAWNPQLQAWRPSVYALALSENKLYVGGDFDGEIGGLPRKNLAALDLTTGTATAWDPRPGNGVFTLMAVNNAVFAGGNFTSIGGQWRNNLAALDATTGSATAWNPGVNGPVNALAATEDVVYAGGRFATVDGQDRNLIAAIDALTGQVTPWNPDVRDGSVQTLALRGDVIYAGGDFTSVNGKQRNHIAAISLATGQISGWNPDADQAVKVVHPVGNVVYAGGLFSSIGGQPRHYLAALDVATGRATAWNPDPDSSVVAVAIAGNTVYAGGHFSLVKGKPRGRLAAIDVFTGQPTAWDARMNDRDAWTLRSYVAALSVSNDVLYAGGSFELAGGQSRSSLAAFDLTDGQLVDWNPGAQYFIFSLAAHQDVVYAGGALTSVRGRIAPGFAAIGKSTRPRNYVTGNVYHETTGDCMRSPDEKGMAGAIVVSQPGNYFASADSLGNYIIAVDTGSYTVRQVIPADKSLLMRQVCPANSSGRTVRFTSYGQTLSAVDFANQVDLRPLLAVNVASDRRRRCFTGTTTVTYRNTGLEAAKPVKIFLKLPQHVVPVRASIPYTLDGEKKLVFDVGTVPAGTSGSIQLIDSVVCNDPNIRGLAQCTKVWITPANSRTPGPDWDGSDITLTARCGNNGRVRLGIYNTGTGPMTDSSAYRVYLDAQLAFTRNYKLAKGDSLVLQVPANGRTVRLEAGQRPGHPAKQSTNVTLEACGTNAQGQVSLGFVAQLPSDDAEPEVDEECLPIIDSFDPNDKAVSPGGVTGQHYTPTRSRLDYVIRFQNTGTDVAYKVVVADTLSADLDVSTLQLGSVSHPYAVKVSGKGRPVLTFTFNNIMLPDSNANEPKSHGYIQFSIRPKADLPEKTRIENFADIFFDYNEPVRTNTTFNTLYDLPPVPAEAVKLDGTVVCVATNTTVTAGSSRTVCVQDTVTLAAILPAQGSGRWQRIGGAATVTDPDNPAARVTGLAYGNNVFEWRVAANTCGTDSLAGRVTITRLRQPAAPAVSQRGADSLACSVAAGSYEWYFEGSPLGLRTRVIQATRPGKYAVRVNGESGCHSEPSPAFAWLPTALAPNLASLVRVYPNPTTGAFVVVLPPDLGQPVQITLSDPVGRALAVRTLPPGTRGEQVVQFDLSAGRPGVYLLKLQTAKGVVVRKVCRQ